MGGVLGDSFDELSKAGFDPAMLNALRGSEHLEVRVEDKDVYVEIGGLPSGGRYYKNGMGVPVKLKGMPLKTQDVVALEAMKNSEDSEVIDAVISRRLKGVNPEDLLEMDRKYILAWLREQTFIRAPLRTTFTCEDCGSINSGSIVNLSDFLVYRLPDNIDEPSFDLPECEERVSLRFERRKDVKRVEEYLKKFASLREVTKGEIKIYRIASVIKGMSLDSAVEFINELSTIDFAVLNTKYEECNMGFSHMAIIKCEKEECEHPNLIHIPFRPEYYLPRIGPDLVHKG